MNFLDSLEAAFEGMRSVERFQEAHELAEAARLSVALADLLRERQGAPVALEMISGARHAGFAQEVNSVWAQLVDASSNLVIVAIAAVAAFSDPGRAGNVESPLQARQRIGMVMRNIARTGRSVLLTSTTGRSWRGHISGVGKDYLELDRKTVVRLELVESLRVV